MVSGALPEDGHEVSTRVKCHVIPMLRTPSPVRDLQAMAKWRNLIKDVKPDVVSIGTPKAAFLGLVAAFWCRVPARVYVLRGLRLEGTRGFYKRMLFLFERLTSLAAHRILSVSDSLAKVYVSSNLARPDKITVLGRGSSHGVNLERFAPLASRAHSELKARHLGHLSDPDTPVIGFVGRFSADKGAKTLLDLKQFLEANNRAHVLVIVGQIEEEAQTLQTMRLSGQSVIVIKPTADIAAIYSLFDILVLPTQREGFPNVVLEAAASAVPSVTTTATGAIDSVEDGKTGFTVPVGDTQAFCLAVEKMLLSGRLRRRLGQAAHRRVKKEFSESFVTQLHEDFYRGLLNER